VIYEIDFIPYVWKRSFRLWTRGGFGIVMKTVQSRARVARTRQDVYSLGKEIIEGVYVLLDEFINKIISWPTWVTVMVFNVTFNNISAIPCRSVLLVEESTDPATSHIMLYWVQLAWAGFELATWVVIGADRVTSLYRCAGSLDCFIVFAID